jgi:hypothetical protein
MTATTQGLAGPGLATGIPAQQGTFGPGFGFVSPGFPPPIGAEQAFGLPSPYGIQAQPGYQQPLPGAVPYLQAVQQLAAQVVPIAQQAILPQVIAVAMQQVHQQLPQLIAQLSGPMAGAGQWPYQLGWQAPAMGLFGQARPYAYS